MRTRLLPEKPPEYTTTRNNYESVNHRVRALTTGAILASLDSVETFLDPACGDASILEAAYTLRKFTSATLGDISHAQILAINPEFPHTKVVSDIWTKLSNSPKHDCVVLTEILEHLEDPDRILRLARSRGDWLVASSPIGDPEDGRNGEHLWAWDQSGYQEMLFDAGWDARLSCVQRFWGTPWNTQIWLAQ